MSWPSRPGGDESTTSQSTTATGANEYSGVVAYLLSANAEMLDYFYYLQEATNAYSRELTWALALVLGFICLYIYRVLGKQEAARLHSHMVNSRPVFSAVPRPVGNSPTSPFLTAYKNRFAHKDYNDQVHEDSASAVGYDVLHRYNNKTYHECLVPRAVWKRHVTDQADSSSMLHTKAGSERLWDSESASLVSWGSRRRPSLHEMYGPLYSLRAPSIGHHRQYRAVPLDSHSARQQLSHQSLQPQQYQAIHQQQLKLVAEQLKRLSPSKSHTHEPVRPPRKSSPPKAGVPVPAPRLDEKRSGSKRAEPGPVAKPRRQSISPAMKTGRQEGQGDQGTKKPPSTSHKKSGKEYTSDSGSSSDSAGRSIKMRENVHAKKRKHQSKTPRGETSQKKKESQAAATASNKPAAQRNMDQASQTDLIKGDTKTPESAALPSYAELGMLENIRDKLLNEDQSILERFKTATDFLEMFSQLCAEDPQLQHLQNRRKPHSDVKQRPEEKPDGEFSISQSPTNQRLKSPSIQRVSSPEKMRFAVKESSNDGEKVKKYDSAVLRAVQAEEESMRAKKQGSETETGQPQLQPSTESSTATPRVGEWSGTSTPRERVPERSGAATPREKVVEMSGSPTPRVVERSGTPTPRVVERSGTASPRVVERSAIATPRVIEKSTTPTPRVLDMPTPRVLDAHIPKSLDTPTPRVLERSGTATSREKFMEWSSAATRREKALERSDTPTLRVVERSGTGTPRDMIVEWNERDHKSTERRDLEKKATAEPERKATADPKRKATDPERKPTADRPVIDMREDDTVTEAKRHQTIKRRTEECSETVLRGTEPQATSVKKMWSNAEVTAERKFTPPARQESLELDSIVADNIQIIENSRKVDNRIWDTRKIFESAPKTEASEARRFTSKSAPANAPRLNNVSALAEAKRASSFLEIIPASNSGHLPKVPHSESSEHVKRKSSTEICEGSTKKVLSKSDLMKFSSAPEEAVAGNDTPPKPIRSVTKSNGELRNHLLWKEKQAEDEGLDEILERQRTRREHLKLRRNCPPTGPNRENSDASITGLNGANRPRPLEEKVMMSPPKQDLNSVANQHLERAESQLNKLEKKDSYFKKPLLDGMREVDVINKNETKTSPNSGGTFNILRNNATQPGSNSLNSNKQETSHSPISDVSENSLFGLDRDNAVHRRLKWRRAPDKNSSETEVKPPPVPPKTTRLSEISPPPNRADSPLFKSESPMPIVSDKCIDSHQSLQTSPPRLMRGSSQYNSTESALAGGEAAIAKHSTDRGISEEKSLTPSLAASIFDPMVQQKRDLEKTEAERKARTGHKEIMSSPQFRANVSMFERAATAESDTATDNKLVKVNIKRFESAGRKQRPQIDALHRIQRSASLSPERRAAFSTRVSRSPLTGDEASPPALVKTEFTELRKCVIAGQQNN